MLKFKKILIIILQKIKLGSSTAPILVKLTGKHKEKIHPKHLVTLEKNQWYEPWIKKGDYVLDIGCGNGQRAVKIANVVNKVTGFDIDPKNIDLAKKESVQLNIKNIKFYIGDAEKRFNFDNESFDVVFFCDVIEHLNNDINALSEVHRVLKKNGVLLLVAPSCDTSWKRLQKKYGLFYFSDPDHKREYRKNELIKKLSKLGFKVLYTAPVVYDTPLSGLIDITGGFSLKLYEKLSLWKLNYAASHPEESIGFRISARKI